MQNESFKEKKGGFLKPFLITLIGCLIVFGFFFAVMLMMNGRGGLGGGTGTGAGFSGKGSGSGDSEGVGRGAAEKGSGFSAGVTAGPGKGGTGQKDSQKPTLKKAADKGNPSPGKVENKNIKKKPGATASAPKKETLVYHLYSTAASAEASHKTSPDNSDTETSSGGSTKGKSGFFGIKSKNNTIYIVDISSSMSAMTKEGCRRIDLLKIQLNNAIRTGYKDNLKTKYLIIAFSNDSYFFPNSNIMKSYNDGRDFSFKKFVNSLSPNGGTALGTAVQDAQRIIAEPANDVRTLYLLTDGEPNDASWPDIISFIRKTIDPKKVTINCISIGKSTPEMSLLAKEYRGTYFESL